MTEQPPRAADPVRHGVHGVHGVLRRLGDGAQGVVYLAEAPDGTCTGSCTSSPT
jgi:hypothetical protein